MPVMVVAAPASATLVARLGARSVVTFGMLVIAFGVVILSTLDAGSGYGHVLAGMVPLGLGMGLTMSPMTELIMSSVPRDKAGVGSAMNDTTREVGTTLGVAVLGSILSSGYTGKLGAVTDALPTELRDSSEGSLAGALVSARRLAESGNAELAQRLTNEAKDAWAHGLQLSMLVGAGIVAVAALVAARYLPGRAGAADPVLEAVPSPLEADLELVAVRSFDDLG
jgi:hypothetical protein